MACGGIAAVVVWSQNERGFDPGENHGPPTFHQGERLLSSCGKALP